MLQNLSHEYSGRNLYTSSSEDFYHWSFLSICIHTFLSLAGLGLLWSHKNFFFKLWMYIDCTFLSVMFPSFISKDKLLEWAQSRLPNNWSSQSKTLSNGLSELWQDGSLLCTVINSAVPGACANPHRHWNKPPIHAQDLAFKYLEVIPVFTEFEHQYPLNIKTERKFFHYLNLLRNKINNISVTKAISQELSKWYVARGMGLYAGEQCKNTIFYIYPQIAVSYYYNILIYIRGPYGTNGQIEFSHVASPEANNFAQSKNVLSKMATTAHFIEKFKNYSGFENIVNKENIKMTVKIEEDRAKVTYLPTKSGIYEIFITCNGEPIARNPFHANIFGTIPVKNFVNATGTKTSNRKFSAEYYIRQTKIISFQNSSNITDDQKEKTSTILKHAESIEKYNTTENKLNIESNENVNSDEKNNLKTIQPPQKRDILLELNNFNKTEKNKSDLKKLCNITIRSLANDLITKVPDNTSASDKIQVQHAINNFKNNAPVVTLAPLYPQTLQNIVTEHQCASSICSDHIESEDKKSNKEETKLENRNFLNKDNQKKSCEQITAKNPASPICYNHIVLHRGLSKSNCDIRQLCSRRDSITSLKSFATDTQSFSTGSESDFETLESLRELNHTPLNKRSALKSIVLEKKMFWETLANHPEIMKMTNIDNLQTSKTLSKSMTRLEEFKNYMKGNKNRPGLRSNRQSKNRLSFSKSVDDLRCSGSAKNMSKFKIVDRSLEDCSKLPVDKRKEIYIKELENLNNNHTKTKSFSESVLKHTNVETNPKAKWGRR